jgi:hypothetical protein
MPNIEILSQFEHSPILKAIRSSNQSKIEREAKARRTEPELANAR